MWFHHAMTCDNVQYLVRPLTGVQTTVDTEGHG